MDRTDEREFWNLIWEKFRAGDRRAFETIYNEYVDSLFAYGLKMTPHRALVEDAIQDTFLTIYHSGSRLRKPESLEFYLFKTLKHIVIRKLKEKYRFTHPEDFVAQFDLKFPLEESELEDLAEHTGMLKEELENLDARKRELLFLKFNSGLTYNEIGTLLDCKPDTVKKQVQRILKLLRGKLGENFLELFVVFYRK